jgi:hypothetical protein
LHHCNERALARAERFEIAREADSELPPSRYQTKMRGCGLARPFLAAEEIDAASGVAGGNGVVGRGQVSTELGPRLGRDGLVRRLWN